MPIIAVLKNAYYDIANYENLIDLNVQGDMFMEHVLYVNDVNMWRNSLVC